MKGVGQNFNNINYQIKAKAVEKKDETEAKEVKGNDKGTAQNTPIAQAEPVTANVLDVIAKQNIGLQGLGMEKPKPVATEQTTGPSGNGGLQSDYNALVEQWDAEHQNWTKAEQVNFLGRIISVAPENEKISWHLLRGELKAEIIEEKLHNVDSNTVCIPEYNHGYGNYEGNFSHDYEDMSLDTDLVSQILPNIPGSPNGGYTNTEIVQAYRTTIAVCRVEIALYQSIINCPNVPEDDKQRCMEHVQFLQEQIRYCQNQINMFDVQNSNSQEV